MEAPNVIVQCPKCKTRYRVDEASVGPPFARFLDGEDLTFRCFRCRTVFVRSGARATPDTTARSAPTTPVIRVSPANSVWRDIFICHATEDKKAVVEPLVTALEKAGITYWYDRAEIQWGDSVPGRVSEGLAMSRYAVVVLSETFVRKHWPQRELNSALSREASTGDVKVLVLLVGSREDVKGIFAKYPLLEDKLWLRWEGNPHSVVEALKTRLR